MQRAAEEEFHEVTGRAATARPGGLPDARDCSPQDLGRLIRREDPGLCHLGLVLLTERVTRCPRPTTGRRPNSPGCCPHR